MFKTKKIVLYKAFIRTNKKLKTKTGLKYNYIYFKR